MFRDPSNVPGDAVCSAQTLAAAALEAIGKIRTAIGSVTVMRADGEIVRVSVGDLVYRGDTIETEADGAVGITFADGTAFNLSAAARLVLNEFVCDPAGIPNSALFSLVQGAFAFIAGKVAKTGGLRIDTPFASIRGSARDRGVGVLTLAALTFAAIEESQAASRHDAFLDDGTITYKDLPHGTFEIVTRDGRVIMADDPGETIVVDPTGSVTRIPNSSSRMAELQQAQHSALATFSLGQEGGAAGGSSSPGFDIPVQLQPINFSPPRNDAPTELVTTHFTAASSGFIEVPPQQLNPPPPPVVTPVLGSAGFSMVTETFNTTGSTHFDTVSSGTLTFTDLNVNTVSATMASMTWSGGATPPSGLAEVLAGALSITTEGADRTSGSIATTFSAADRNFDFLAANETLTIVYDVTVTDNEGVSLTRPVTITIIGTNDTPVLAADASGPHTVTEGLNTTGTFAFTDVDLTDHHTVSTSVTSATWSGGATLPSGVAAALAGALSATASDGTGSGSGSVAVTFSAADDNFDFLAAGQTLTIVYDVTVTDITGASSTQPVTITITGTNDAPVATITPTSYSTAEQVSLNLKNSMSVSDVDGLGGVETVTLSVTEGTLTVTAGTSGATVLNNGTNSVTITGTLAQINALLNTDSTSTVSYIDATDTPSASATLTLSINDNGLSGGAALTGSDTAIINIGSVNDAPVATITPTTYSTAEQVSLNLKNSMSVSDVDSLGGVETVTLSVTEGTLTVTAGTSGAAVLNNGTNSVTITGTLAQINALLNTDSTSTVSYIDATDTPSASATLTLSINDNGLSGGAALTGSDTAIINIGSVNDAPVATITPATYSAAEQVSLNLKNSMSVSDVDSLGGVETVTLSVTEGTLTVTAGTSGATVLNNGTNSVTITGTLAQINALLNTDSTSTVSYIDATDTPSASATLTLSINDNGHSGGAALTGSDTAIINIGSVNDAPVATITPTSYSAAEQVSLNLKNSMSVSDVDSLGGVETVTLSVTEGTLTVTAGTSGAVVGGSGTNSVTITGTLAQINALLNTDSTSTVSYIDATDTPSASATLTLSINDNGLSGGAALTGSDTAIINIGSVNDAPVATITPTTYSTAEQVSLNLKNSMSVSDVDSLGGVETATLSVTEGTLTVTAGTSGAVVSGSGTNSVTVTGTLAQINALLNTDSTSTVSYIDPTDTPSASATLTLSINDNGLSGGAALTGNDTAIINIGSVNDAPVATITPTSYSTAEQVSLNLKNSMSVSDVDSLGGVETATLSVTEGTLTVTAGTSGATVLNNGTNSVTITGTLAQINALLNTDSTSTVSYIDPTNTPSASATLTLSINDNGLSGGAALTGSDTAIINIGSVNDAPVATITPTSYSAAEQVSLNLKNSMSVSDVDSLGGVETVTLSVTEGTLTVTAGTSGATVSGSGTNSVTITGTLAQINALLNTDSTSTVSYIDPTDTPSASATLTLSINDNGFSGGAALTGSDTAIINIGSVNDAPVATITPTTYSTAEQVSLNLKNSMSVSDVDGLGGVETVTLSVTEGTLTVTAGTSGATVLNNGTNSVTITGTLAQINALLNTDSTSTVSYIDATDTPSASATLTLSINDNGLSGGAALTGSDTAIINIGSVNDAPVATITPTSYSAAEQVSLNLKNSMSVSDVDSLGGVETVTLSVTEGTLTVTAGTSGATVLNNGTNSVTITGTLAQINALLNTDSTSTVSYIDATDTPSASATLTLSINDNGLSGGAALTGSDTAIINIGSVNDAPVATITPTTYSTAEQVSLNLKNSMSVSDVDSLGGVETATLSVTEGTLTVTAGTSGAVVSGSGTNSVTVTGTLAQINALLNTDSTSTVSYIDPTDTPSASATLTLSINDNGFSGGAALTGNDTAIINIGSVNDVPVATITPTTYSTAEQVSLNLKNSMSVSDVDSLGGVETATLSVTEGTLTVTAGTSGATVLNNGTNSVTITGTLAQINALLNTDSTSTVSYIDPTNTPSASATLTLSINDNGLSGGAALTGSDTAIINIGSVNDAPVATITPTSYSTAEQVSLNLKNSMSVSDVDSLGGVETVTLSVTEGTLTVTAGTSGATVLNNGPNSVTITGTLAQINALLNTDSTSTVSYIDPTDTPSASATLTLSINDNGFSGGAALTGSDTAIINITAVNDAPVITSGAAAVAVSEEGLPNSVPDTLPAGLDTTNSRTASGTITASDADGDALTMSLGTPSASLTSGGVAIAWTLQGAGHTLIGKAGTATIITATITDAGTYNVALTGPIDHPFVNQEDNKPFAVPVTVSDGHTTTSTTLSVTIEDDSPKAAPVEVSVVATDSKTNVMLILDVSGSMDSPSGLPGLTRLEAAKAAVNELLDQYDSRGDVMVRIVTFSTAGTAVGSAWKSVADAKVDIANLSAGGNTNYDAALLTAMTAFTAGTKLSGPGTQNVSYFLSDGEPTTGSDWPQINGTQSNPGIQDNERGVWEAFLTTNNIVSFALGISNGAPQTANLNPIAFDPASGTQLADTPIIVTDLGQLANALVFTIPPVTGSVLTSAGGAPPNSFGADGGYVQSITVDGVTYTFLPAANGGAGGITTSGGGSFTYNGTTKTLTVDTNTSVVGGELAMVMTTGAFTFQPPIDFSSEAVGYVLVDGDGDTASSMLHFSGAVLPAGVAGSPINLGLTDPADHVGSVTVAIAGVPSGWTLSEGTNNGDGSWTIQASGVSMLSITSPDNYAGAMALQVTMSWTNADGSTGFARVSDNVEVFAQGAPIFAWSADDHLTGSMGKDLFVIAQPIGYDTIYSFNASEDQIDLVGYPRFANFEDVQRHLAEDGAGNAVITLADGQSITLSGVPVSSLSASNFVFDHTPALSNAGTMTIDDGAVLPMSGIITNTGTIALDSTGNETHLELIQNGITLQGGGQVLLSDSDENLISGTIPSVTLTNVDNTISGAGQLGAGRMTLINNGTIIAIGTHALVIDTGPNAVTNAGTLEATGSGGLILNSDIVNSGLIWANGGNITINGAVAGSGSAMISGAAALELGAASSTDVSFGPDAAGTLILGDPSGFTGTISGLSTDHIDLANISSGIASLYSITHSLSTDITTLVITDGTNTDTLNLLGNYTINTAWHFSDDGHGGTIVSDAPVSATNDLLSVQSTSTDNNLLFSSPFTAANDNGDGQTDVSSATADGTAAKDIPSVTAVENAKGDDAAHTHGAAAKDSSTIDTTGAAVAHTDSSGSQGAAPGEMNDQFHFAYTNPDTSQSTELPSQAASHPAVEIPASTTDNSDLGHGNDFNPAALPNAVEDAKGSDKAQIRGAAAKDLSTIDVAGATVADNDSVSVRGAASEHGNDQFHFANANPGNNGLGHQSLELPSQAASPAAVDIPPATTELAQILDDILTQAAQAPLDTVTAPGQNHELPWSNAHQDKPSNDFIIHA